MTCAGVSRGFTAFSMTLGVLASSFGEASGGLYDVVVYGGTASGVVAAVAARLEGKTVALIEPGRHLGGMVSGGLGATDHGNRGAIGGISREFFRRVLDHYVKVYGAGSPQVKDCSDGFKFEPHVAEAIFLEMIREAKVEVLLNSTLKSVKRDGLKIGSLVTNLDEVIIGDIFIDASYEGDLMARVGVKYAVGREGREEYGESLAGVQARSPPRTSGRSPSPPSVPITAPCRPSRMARWVLPARGTARPRLTTSGPA